MRGIGSRQYKLHQIKWKKTVKTRGKSKEVTPPRVAKRKRS